MVLKAMSSLNKLDIAPEVVALRAATLDIHHEQAVVNKIDKVLEVDQ